MGSHFSRFVGSAANATDVVPSSIPVPPNVLDITEEVINMIINRTVHVLNETMTEPATSATRWTLPLLIDAIINASAKIGYYLVIFLPLIIAKMSSINWKNFKAWSWMISMVHFRTYLFLASLSIAITFVSWFDSSYMLGANIFAQQIAECAFRFQELECESNLKETTERECFALGMCITQPVWALGLQVFLSEFWANYVVIAGIFKRGCILIGLLSIYVHSFVKMRPWPLDLEFIVTGGETVVPVENEHDEYRAYQPASQPPGNPNFWEQLDEPDHH